MGTTAAPRMDSSVALVERVQELQDQLDRAADTPTRDVAEELVATIVQLYGEGLERIVGGLVAAGEAGATIAAGLTEDPLVSTLLLIHDLHPVPLQERVQAALDSVRPYMESHGGNVELLSLEDGVARINLQGSCSDCSASAVTLELAIKQALEEAAPDLAELQVEGVAPQLTGMTLPMVADPAPSGLELPVIISTGAGAPAATPAAPAPAPEPAWCELEVANNLAEGELMAITLGALPLIVANVEGTLLAYRDECAACGEAIHDGHLSEGALTCPACERMFFLPRAGRSMDEERIQLTPVPLLRERGSVKVAVAL